jgi:hypothetical protein
MGKLTLRAMALLEQPLRWADHLDERVIFIGETIQSVKRKLETMQDSAGTACLTGFDYNEKLIIRQALLMYSLDLLGGSHGLQQTEELQLCCHIAMHFADSLAKPVIDKQYERIAIGKLQKQSV